MLTRLERREVDGLRLAGLYEAARKRHAIAAGACRGFAWEALAHPAEGVFACRVIATVHDEPDRAAERIFRVVLDRREADLHAHVWAHGPVETDRGNYVIDGDGALAFRPAAGRRREEQDSVFSFQGRDIP